MAVNVVMTSPSAGRIGGGGAGHEGAFGGRDWLRQRPEVGCSVHGEVFVKGDEGLTSVLGDADGVGDADGLVPVHAAHPADEMEGLPRLKGPGIAFRQGEDVALVPGGWEGDADRVAGA